MDASLLLERSLTPPQGMALPAPPTSLLDSIFAFSLKPDPLIWQQHDPWLVALALVASEAGKYSAPRLAELFVPLKPQLIAIHDRWAD